MRYGIIEDEAPARMRLKRLVGELRPEAVCVGEAEDGVSGLELLREHGARLELLFLDIEFPPAGAFDLLEKARASAVVLPRIAFVTAYDRFAIEAFRWAACDYLLKPLERDRLRETLDRIDTDRPDLQVLLQAVRASQARQAPTRFTVRSRDRVLVLSWDQVSHIVTENRLVFVHCPRGRFVLDRTLDELEQVLGPRFFRTHRSAMVALDRVAELDLEPSGVGEAVMADGNRVPVSRERLAAFRRALEE